MTQLRPVIKSSVRGFRVRTAIAMTKFFLGLTVTFASVTNAVAVDEMLSRGHKLNFLLAAVLAALIGVALVMPGEW